MLRDTIMLDSHCGLPYFVQVFGNIPISLINNFVYKKVTSTLF